MYIYIYIYIGTGKHLLPICLFAYCIFAYCLLPLDHCLMPVSYCPLPAPSWLVPIASLRNGKSGRNLIKIMFDSFTFELSEPFGPCGTIRLVN